MWPNRFAYFSPEDDKGGGGGGDQKTPEQLAQEAEQAREQRFAALEKATGLMAEGYNQLTSTVTQMVGKLDQIIKPQDDKDKNKGSGKDDDVDLETMDRKQYAQWLIGQMKGVVDESMKPLGEKFGQLDEKIDGTALSVMIKEFQKDHPDFFEWKDEMKGLLKENPTLTPARAYSLARTESPDKARKMNEKYKLGQPEKKIGDSTFLSLFPQGGSATKSNGAGKMQPKQAAEAAWDSVMSSLGQ